MDTVRAQRAVCRVTHRSGDGRLLALVVLLNLITSASVQGTVRAEGSREPIAHATLQLPELRRGVLSDSRGYFVLTGVPEGSWRLRAGALGYRTHEVVVQVPASGVVRLDLELAWQPVELAGIDVRGVRARPPAEESGAAAEAGPAPLRLDPSVVSTMPALAEADVLRTLQTLPAVQAISDFSSALYVRGGSADQNLLLLDGAPLFNPYHLVGLFSAIDPDAIAGVELHPGAFPARLGDRLSSVIEVRTRDGGRDRIRSNGGVGFISSRASLDGPLPGRRGSFVVSGRRTYLDLFTDAAYAAGLISATVPYAFSDAYLKVTHDVGALGRLSASAYLNDEWVSMPERMRTDFDEDLSFDWGSRLVTLRYWQPFGPSVTGEFRAALSSFTGSFEAFWEDGTWHEQDGVGVEDVRPRRLDVHTRARDLLAGGDLTWFRGTHRVRVGAQLDSYLFDHDFSTLAGSDQRIFPEFERMDRPRTLAAYVEDEWSPAERLELRLGMRMLHAGAWGTAWMPRFGARLALAPRLSLSLGGGRSAQVMHSLKYDESLFGSVISYDLLAAVPAESGLTRADDVAVGLEWRTPGTTVRLDGYLKRMQSLPLPPLPGGRFLDTPGIVADGYLEGSGRARGLEFMAQHARGSATFQLGYAFTAADRTVEGEDYTPRFERRQTLDALAALPLGRAGQLSTRLTLGTGQPYTPVVGVGGTVFYEPRSRSFWPRGSGPQMMLGDHNSDRLPGYLRLDAAARRHFERRWFGRQTTIIPYLQVINVLNTKNVMAAMPEIYGAQPRLQYAPQLPLFPTAGVEWKF